MKRKNIVFFLSVFLFLGMSSWLVASEPKESDEKREEILPPQSETQAQELFEQAWRWGNDQNTAQALRAYQLLFEFYGQEDGKERSESKRRYQMLVANNMAISLSQEGKYYQAIAFLEKAIRFAEDLKDWQKKSDFHFKIGRLYLQLRNLEEAREQRKEAIFPHSLINGGEESLFSGANIYTRFAARGDRLALEKIQMGGSYNPFQNQSVTHTKLINLTLLDGFLAGSLLVPDTVEISIEARKSGYYPLKKRVQLLPDVDLSKVAETMTTIPRKIKYRILEDFYKKGEVTPNEIHLTLVEQGNLIGKPMTISERESFRPGEYLLSIQKAGYEPISEFLTLYPGEKPLYLTRTLQSKLRTLRYEITGDFTQADGENRVKPDEISLDKQAIEPECQVKPGHYQLVVRKEGYEPVIENFVIPPDERPYSLKRFMPSLPRKIIFDLEGDYQKGQITPDEISVNGRAIQYGESLTPNVYQVAILKKGYELITKRVTIPPSQKDFILKETLASSLRKVELNIVAKFPKGIRLTPEFSTLNGKDIRSHKAFKPGSYKLEIRHSGYEKVEREVQISPSNSPFVLQQFVDAKKRPLELMVKYEVPHENPETGFRAILKNEGNGLEEDFTPKMTVTPSSYLLTIGRPGYLPHSRQVTILPGENPWQIECTLPAAEREVVAFVQADFPAGADLVPDEITLSSRPLQKGIRVAPGKHELVILREGYLPVRKMIDIPASEKSFVFQEQLEARERLVTFLFWDNHNRQKISQADLLLNKDFINDNEPITLKPGNYALSAKLNGYHPLAEQIEIPVGSDPLVIDKYLAANLRPVVSFIRGDYQPKKELQPDIFTLNDTPVTKDFVTQPGEYELFIEKEGYQTIARKIKIGPGSSNFNIEETLVSLPRTLEVQTFYYFDGKREVLLPDTLQLSGESFLSETRVKPGAYVLSVSKAGYHSLSEEKITIEPGVEKYLVEKVLSARPRPVEFIVRSDYNENIILPDILLINEETNNAQTELAPGRHQVRIEKRGFHNYNKEIWITPGVDPYKVEAVVESIPRKMELIVTGDFPIAERFDPHVAALGGLDLRSNVFKPGQYELTIQQPGYDEIRETLILPPGEENFLIERILPTKPRLVEEKIYYNIEPPKNLAPYQIFLENEEAQTEAVLVKAGDKIKPGNYRLKIEKEGYQTLQMNKNIWPGEDPIIFDQQLMAKQVSLNINVTHDVLPPSGHPDYKVMLTEEKKSILIYVKDKNKVTPGKYYLQVQQDGYQFGTRKLLDITPRETIFSISEKVLAKERKISFQMVDDRTGVLVPALEICMDKREIDFHDTFKPGQEYDLTAKFQSFKTVSKRTNVTPGEGPFVQYVKMEPLKAYEFTLRKQNITLDKTEYPFTFFLDDKKVEDHLIRFEKGLSKFYYTVWGDPVAKTLKVMGGYRFSQNSIKKTWRLDSLDSINVPLLIEHLENLNTKGPRTQYREPLEAMEALMKRAADRERLRQAHFSELKRLQEYIESWPIITTQERIRCRLLLELLAPLVQPERS